jgi:hypothetical protein
MHFRTGVRATVDYGHALRTPIDGGAYGLYGV